MRRLLMILTVCCAVLVTAACSGDDGKENEAGGDDNPSASPTEEKSEGTNKQVAKTTPCTAEVSTSGAYEGAWSGEAEVRTGGKSVDDTGPKAVYTLTDKKNRLSIYSPGAEFKGSVTLSVGNTAYASDPADAESFDIDEKGKSASVDATLTSTGGDKIDLVADFTCGKTKKKS